jgi:tetratricopeptide (TPR) repeat protein
MKRMRSILLFMFLSVGSSVYAQEKQPWTGIKVVTKFAQPIRLDDGGFDDGTSFRVYVVKEAVEDRLHISWENSQGWIDTSKVVRIDDAIEFYTIEIEENPRNTAAHDWRGMVWYSKKDFDKAIADYDQSIALNPTSSFAWNNRGLCWSSKKDYQKAIDDFDRAIDLKPDHALAYNNRGVARQNLREYEKAFADFARAIELKSEFLKPYNERAWLWATCPDERFRDGEKAIASATKACELSGWKDPNILDTLAAAYAESGFYQQARQWQEKAVALTRAGDPDRKKYRDRLELYKKSRPYRIP